MWSWPFVESKIRKEKAKKAQNAFGEDEEGEAYRWKDVCKKSFFFLKKQNNIPLCFNDQKA